MSDDMNAMIRRAAGREAPADDERSGEPPPPRSVDAGERGPEGGRFDMNELIRDAARGKDWR